jgi:hypothetical protein
MYKYTVVYQEKANPNNYYTPTIIAFTKKDLHAQAIAKRPEKFKFVRIVKNNAGIDATDLHPRMPDMIVGGAITMR